MSILSLAPSVSDEYPAAIVRHEDSFVGIALSEVAARQLFEQCPTISVVCVRLPKAELCSCVYEAQCFFSEFS